MMRWSGWREGGNLKGNKQKNCLFNSWSSLQCNSERKWEKMKKVMIWKCEKKEIGNEKNILFSSSSFNCSHASCIENKLERCYKYGILMLWHVHTSSLMFLKVIDFVPWQSIKKCQKNMLLIFSTTYLTDLYRKNYT